MNNICAVGLTELVGTDEALAATNYSASVEMSFPTFNIGTSAKESGEIISVALYAYNDNTAAVLETAGDLFFFQSDPSIAANATALTAAGADHKLMIGTVPINSSDWVSDGSGGIAHKAVAIPFQALPSVFVSYQAAVGATTVNSAGGDEEHIDLRFWYRRDT